MATYDYNATLETAKKLLTKFGLNCSVKINKGVALDPLQPWLGEIDTFDEYNCLGVRLPITDNKDVMFLQNSAISSSAFRFILSDVNTLSNSSLILYDGSEYKIVKYSEIAPTSISIIYDCIAVEVG